MKLNNLVCNGTYEKLNDFEIKRIQYIMKEYGLIPLEVTYSETTGLTTLNFNYAVYCKLNKDGNVIYEPKKSTIHFPNNAPKYNIYNRGWIMIGKQTSGILEDRIKSFTNGSYNLVGEEWHGKNYTRRIHMGCMIKEYRKSFRHAYYGGLSDIFVDDFKPFDYDTDFDWICDEINRGFKMFNDTFKTLN